MGLTPMFDFRMPPGSVIQISKTEYLVGSKYGKPVLTTRSESDLFDRKSSEPGSSSDSQ